MSAQERWSHGTTLARENAYPRREPAKAYAQITVKDLGGATLRLDCIDDFVPLQYTLTISIPHRPSTAAKGGDGGETVAFRFDNSREFTWWLFVDDQVGFVRMWRDTEDSWIAKRFTPDRRVLHFDFPAGKIAFPLAGAYEATRAMLAACGYQADAEPKVAETRSKHSTHGVWRRSALAAVAPFVIKTQAGANYFFKLVQVQTGAEHIAGFVVGGQSFSTQVPIGQYELRYAVGEHWIDETDYFGPETAFAKTATPLKFARHGEGVTGVEVTLVRTRGGNLRTEPMTKSAF